MNNMRPGSLEHTALLYCLHIDILEINMYEMCPFELCDNIEMTVRNWSVPICVWPLSRRGHCPTVTEIRLNDIHLNTIFSRTNSL